MNDWWVADAYYYYVEESDKRTRHTGNDPVTSKPPACKAFVSVSKFSLIKLAKSELYAVTSTSMDCQERTYSK